MQANRRLLGLRIIFAAITVALMAASSVASEKVLHNFGISNNDGQNPQAGLIFDGAGNLYGTTTMGGSKGYGTVFEASPNGSGGWTERVLHNFGLSDDDGLLPTAGLIFDRSGNLYGTAQVGGRKGGGIAFELTPDGSGNWTERVLHTFGSRGDGDQVYAGLVFDGAGNLYGTTVQGGSEGWGTVFELTPDGSGGWTESVLHNFALSGDGHYPYASLIFDGAGNLYGTTSLGGSKNAGTVFEMTANGSGGWTERVLHNFGISHSDGLVPVTALIFDGGGNLYGTTRQGGSQGQVGGQGYGTVFEMTPDGSGRWTERVLHNFGIRGSDGREPLAGLVFDVAGHLYGTTWQGGSEGFGTVFEMTPDSIGHWAEQALHNFGIGENDGLFPAAGLIIDGAGNLYGTTEYGGSNSGSVGTVFEVIP